MADPYFSNVTLLLHCDGSDGSTTFTDVKGHTVTPAGNAQIDTAQAKFGGASGLFDGSSDYLTIPSATDFDLTGSSTIEFWFLANGASSTGASLLELYANSSNSIHINQFNAPLLRCRIRIGGTNYTIDYTGAQSFSLWHHVAVTYDGSSYRLWFDGASVGSVAAGTFSGGAVNIGRNGANSSFWNGWIDDLRITNGVARYTENFTPPTEAFADASASVTRTLTLDAGAAISGTRTATVNAASYLSYPAATGALPLGGGAVIQRRFTRTASLNAAVMKQGLTRSTTLNAWVQKRLTQTAGGDSVIGRMMTLWAVAGAAELGVQQFLTLAAGYLLAGREYIPSDALVQATLAKYASANSYVSLVGLTRSTIVDALFSSFKRIYASAAVQGTARLQVACNFLVSGLNLTGVTASVDACLARTLGLIAVVNAYLAKTTRLRPGSNAWLAKTRRKSPQAGAVLGVIVTQAMTGDAVLRKRNDATWADLDSVLQARLQAVVSPSAALQQTRPLSCSAGAYLRAGPLHLPITTTTLIDGEWVCLDRPVAWTPDARPTEFAPDARPTEWLF